MSAEARLKELGLVLPTLPKPVANYLPYRLAGNLLFLAGQGPRDEKGATLTGKLGADISIDEGYRRARLVGLGLLAAIRDALGSLDRVDFMHFGADQAHKGFAGPRSLQRARIFARLGGGHQRDPRFGDLCTPLLSQLLQFVQPALLGGVVGGEVTYFPECRCEGIAAPVIGLQEWLIGGDQIAAHAGFLIQHRVHCALQAIQHVGGVDTPVLGPFDHAKSVVDDCAADKYDCDHDRKRSHKLARDWQICEGGHIILESGNNQTPSYKRDWPNGRALATLLCMAR